jgi:hypothetical protein
MVFCFRGTIATCNTYLPIKKLPESPENWPVGSQNKPPKKREAMLCPPLTPPVIVVVRSACEGRWSHLIPISQSKSHRHPLRIGLLAAKTKPKKNAQQYFVLS